MTKEVKDFLLTQGLTKRDLEYRPNFTFIKVELMIQNALKQGQKLPIDSVSSSFNIKCDNCKKTLPFAMAIDVWCKIDKSSYCLNCQKLLKIGWYK